MGTFRYVHNWFVALLGVSLVFVAALLLLARWNLRVSEVRMRLLEARQRDFLAAMTTLGAASRQSAHDVMDGLAQSAFRFEPAADTFLVFTQRGEQLCAAFSKGARAEPFGNACYSAYEQNMLAAALRCGHRVASDGKIAPLVPTDTAAMAIPLPGCEPKIVAYIGSRKLTRMQSADSLVELCELAAAPLALAAERESDREKATYDGLTGLLTARTFRSMLADEVAIARLSDGSTVGLWFIDTDHFKTVNDTLGHAAGDIVLQKMAKILIAHAVVGIDIVARNGGDEFCAILRKVTKSKAIMRAQALCEEVAATDFGVNVKLTASIGVAMYPDDAQSSAELLEIADAAMYNSKRNGRNCVSYATLNGDFALFARERAPA